MPVVWFIRHGESVSNANLPTTHPAESALTPRGKREAQWVVRAFTRKPDLIVVSPFMRAQQTAVPTIQQFAPVPVETWPVQEFTYLHPGRYDGTTGNQRGPYAQAYWERNNPEEKEAGEGESFVELMGRVEGVITRLQAHPAKFMAVFTHGLFTRALLWTLLAGAKRPTPQAMARYAHFIQAIHMPNASILQTTFEADRIACFPGFNIAHLPED